MTNKKIIEELKLALLKERLKSIPKDTIDTVAEALDTYGVLNFAGDSNRDNLKIKDCITEAISFFKPTRSDEDDEATLSHAEQSVSAEGIECHTTVREAIYMAIRDNNK